MASPTVNGHPSTPPSSDPATTTAPAQAPSQPTALPTAPLNSLTDDGDTKRPRDARLIHLVLSSLGIHSYQERVPLQLLDFAYRYTSSVLSDSLRLSSEGYQGSTERNAGGRRGAGAGGEDGAISVTALRQAIASRTGYHFHPGGALPKEFMLEQAHERNKVALPRVERGYGVQLPSEKYCLTGVGWGMKEEWDSEEEIEMDVGDRSNGVRSAEREDEAMEGVEGDAEGEDEEGMGRMEDVFGEEEGAGDTSMAEG
ncbi:Transcription initiation factor TFIID subunit 9 [Saxophila tyrrhenica]|uniref:Transcription initiation factor TFIID subunit 9 n=1 Tax=Saxophila tyrrhenica TaxID=1690608 RepID=A0AAV9PE27_9PEZI|nr:Transcription initiation factor TFIID subunit 9 [Saxophila tyrrhenica]